MIACFDVYYTDDHARAAAVVFSDWGDESGVEQFTVQLSGAAGYVPGAFYQRELEPLLAVVERIPLPVTQYVIDGYCHLSASGEPGLGDHFHRALPPESIVIGVAKNRFRDTTHAVELLRGSSARPLFVTSIGIDYPEAAERVRSMAGAHRIPTLLKEVDRLSRSDAS